MMRQLAVTAFVVSVLLGQTGCLMVPIFPRVTRVGGRLTDDDGQALASVLVVRRALKDTTIWDGAGTESLILADYTFTDRDGEFLLRPRRACTVIPIALWARTEIGSPYLRFFLAEGKMFASTLELESKCRRPVAVNAALGVSGDGPWYSYLAGALQDLRTHGRRASKEDRGRLREYEALLLRYLREHPDLEGGHYEWWRSQPDYAAQE